MKKSVRSKPFTQMNADELGEATKEFDRENAIDSFRELSPQERAKWKRAKRKRGRPRQGAGAKVISVSLEKGLLKQSDNLAKRLGVTRASLIAQGLQKIIAAQSR